ncbi:MAG: hypothetical protein AB7T22_14780 [Calditrichaceae bacterium]
MLQKILKRMIFIPVFLVSGIAYNCSDMQTQPEQSGEKDIVKSVRLLENGVSQTCEDGIQNSGAYYRICVPDDWNGELVVYAHGYVAPDEPLAVQDNEIDGTTISEIINQMGYAFATSSYRDNGLIIPDAVQDLVELTEIFKSGHGDPEYVYLIGASEGGAVTALGIEMYPGVFDGGLATCGPVGDFKKQIDYFSDFRVVFDYFFPNIIPGTAVDVPEEVMMNWSSKYEPRIKNVIAENPQSTRQLLRVTRAPVDLKDSKSIESTVIGILWYTVFATNDAIKKLGGQPFDNMTRFYSGSENDLLLNMNIGRFKADESAVTEIEARYQTSGELINPLVTMHTTGDPIVPYWHEPLYNQKIFQSGSARQHFNIPVFRYGHCNFQMSEVIAGFTLLILKVSLKNLIITEKMIPDPGLRMEINKLSQNFNHQREISVYQPPGVFQ